MKTCRTCKYFVESADSEINEEWMTCSLYYIEAKGGCDFNKFSCAFHEEAEVDLAAELAKFINSAEENPDMTFDDFFDEFGIPAEERSDFFVAALLNQINERGLWDEDSDNKND